MLAVWPTATCLRFLEKPMKNRIRTIFVLAILCAAMSTAGLASNNAYLYLVQGVPGLDYATGIDPQLSDCRRTVTLDSEKNISAVFPWTAWVLRHCQRSPTTFR